MADKYTLPLDGKKIYWALMLALGFVTFMLAVPSFFWMALLIYWFLQAASFAIQWKAPDLGAVVLCLIFSAVCCLVVVGFSFVATFSGLLAALGFLVMPAFWDPVN